MDFERYYSGRAVVFRAFPVSLMVMLRMAPILAAVGLVATGLFASVASNWIALAMVVFLTIAPITYFVALNTIRAALVQIGQTTEPDGGRLIRSSVHVFLFHLVTALPILLLVGFSYAAMLKYGILDATSPLAHLDPDQELTWFVVISAMRGFIGFILIATSLFYLYFAALLVPMAGVAASAVLANQPRHGIIYGFGSKLLPLFFVLVIANAANLMSVFMLSPISEVDAIAMGFREFLIRIGGIVFVNFWSVCYIGSAAALAYVSYRNMDAFERKELLRALEQSGGPKADHDALRAFTLEGSRQSAVKSYDPNNPG